MTDEQEEYVEIPSLGTVTGPAPATHHVLAKPLTIPTVEQMQLIARILDGLVKTTPSLMPHPDETGLLNVGKCRYCGVIGQVHGVYEIRHDHTDVCILALNAQLQASLRVSISQHNEEQVGE